MHELVCKCCSKAGAEVFYQVDKVPVNSCLLIATRNEAIGFPSGVLRLAFCSNCGFVWNADFEESLIEYSENYEGTQGYSATFNRFHTQLAQDLIKRYDLHGKRILEIGCGKGEFLRLLCAEGNNTGIGFDPAFIQEEGSSPEVPGLTFIRDIYSEKFAGCKADFVCCKMTLEHICEPQLFLQMVRRTIGDFLGATVLFQVPDAGKAITEGAMEDFYYEHCSYFSHSSLGRLFQRCGFAVQSVESVYDQQYLIIEARPTAEKQNSLLYDAELQALKVAVKQFRLRSARQRSIWNNQLTEWERAGRKVVVWGSGSRAVGFLTALANVRLIKYIVDINPNKAGTFTAGTGQEIVTPEFLPTYRPDDVIVMNAIYKDEISAQVASLGLHPEIHTLR